MIYMQHEEHAQPANDLNNPSQSASLVDNVPTPKMRQGDFSELLGSQTGNDDLGRPIYAGEIYDPATTRTLPDGTIIRDSFNYNGQLNNIDPARFKLDDSPRSNVRVRRCHQFNTRTKLLELDVREVHGGRPRTDLGGAALRSGIRVNAQSVFSTGFA